jgi:hypothetical protein
MLDNGIDECQNMLHFPNIDEMASDGSSSSHGRTDQVSASASTLPTFEVAITGGGAALSLFELVPIHGDAHAASCLPPLKSRLPKDVS